MRIRKSCQQEFFTSQTHQPIDFIQRNPEVFFSNARPAVRNVMNQMILGATIFPNDYRSQMTISKYAGYKCRETTNRALKILEQAGCVIRNYRHKKTNEYKISAWFRDPYIKIRLAKIFTAIKILPLSILLTSSIQANEQKVTQRIFENLKVSYFNILKPISTDRLTQVSSLSTKKIVPAYLVRPILYGDPDGGEKKIREKVMEPNQNPISQAIRDIGELPLTKWGQIKLSAFPDEAIRYARFELSKTNPADPFTWFFKVCLTFCHKNKIAPDWRTMVALSQRYNMPDDAKMLLNASDNEYYPTKSNLKKPYSTTSFHENSQSVKKKPQKGMIESSSFGESSLQSSIGSLKKTDDFVERKRLQEDKVNQEDPYLAAKKVEESLHTPGGKFLFDLLGSHNPFITCLSEIQQKQLLEEVHRDCSCPFRMRTAQPIKPLEIQLQDSLENMNQAVTKSHSLIDCASK